MSAPGYPLTSEPWIPVEDLDGNHHHISLNELIRRPQQYRRLSGPLPTVDAALLRLILAILYAAEAPRTRADWEAAWNTPRSLFDKAAAYLAENESRFRLTDPHQPFMQAVGMRTTKGDTDYLSRLIGDTPSLGTEKNGVIKQFMGVRSGTDMTLTHAEAAQWVLHAHAWDPQGIRTGCVGDPRAEAGKVFGRGLGVCGYFGLIHTEGANLQETLLLNLVPLDELDEKIQKVGTPAWMREAQTPEEFNDDRTTPDGICDLYTWQSRRVQLFEGDGMITGCLLTYGDQIDRAIANAAEPMTTLRVTRQKKLSPAQHRRDAHAWRSLPALLAPEGGKTADVMRWLRHVTTEGHPQVASGRATMRLVGCDYGAQAASIDHVWSDSVDADFSGLDEQNLARLRDMLTLTEAFEGAAAKAAARILNGAAYVDTRVAVRDALDAPARAWVSTLTASDTDPLTTWAEQAVPLVTARVTQAVEQSRNPIDAMGHARWFRWEMQEALKHHMDDDTLKAVTDTIGSELMGYLPEWSSAENAVYARVAKSLEAIGIRDDGPARAQRAQWRRMLGTDGMAAYSSWGDEILIDFSPPRTEDAVRAVTTAVALYAWHAQGQLRNVYATGRGTGLGRAIRRAADRSGSGDQALRLLKSVAANPNPTALRQVVAFLRKNGVPLNYARLARDLYMWNTPQKAEVIRSWGHGYHMGWAKDSEETPQQKTA